MISSPTGVERECFSESTAHKLFEIEFSLSLLTFMIIAYHLRFSAYLNTPQSGDLLKGKSGFSPYLSVISLLIRLVCSNMKYSFKKHLSAICFRMLEKSLRTSAINLPVYDGTLRGRYSSLVSVSITEADIFARLL